MSEKNDFNLRFSSFINKMGIKDLSKFIRTNTKSYEEVHLSKFFGKKIAVDISVFLYKTIRTQGEDKWMMPMVILLRCLKKYGIKIVCVFDGPNAPPEKLKERAERKKNSDRIRSKAEEVQNLLAQIHTYMDRNYMELPRDLRIKIREVVNKQRDASKYDNYDFRDINVCLKVLEELEVKFAKQSTPITRDHGEIVKEIVRHLGMAVMQADGEAETLCAYMCVRGMVDAVLTEDSDVLAYETPIFLSKIDTRKETVMMLRYDDLISQMHMTAPQFKDFCIMCSCDYNDRIKLPLKPGKTKQTGIGPNKAYNLLMEHGSIDNIEYATDLDVTPLNYKRCRFLFTVPDHIYEGLVLPYNKPINLPEVEKFLKKHRCGFLLSQVKEAWAPTPIEFVEDEEYANAKMDLYDEIESDEEHNEELRRDEHSEELHSEDEYEKMKKDLYDELDEDVIDEFEDIKLNDSQSRIEVYTDGSCSRNPGPGGWAAQVEVDGNKKILKGHEDGTTNNRMELLAAIKALEYISQNLSNTQVKLHTDSEYVKNGITRWISSWKKNGWKTSSNQKVKNIDLWKSLDFYNHQLDVEWEWVKGHSGNEGNDIVDRIAQQESKKM